MLPRFPPPPDTLWHYTDATGLHGIVSSGQLRFGDARFLNDRTERIYGEQMLENAFGEFVASHSNGGTAFRDLVRVLRLPDRLYVCSLSATKESISQWQRYGANGGGYCIGFDFHMLDDLLDSENVSCQPMLYDESQQQLLLRDAIQSGFDEYLKLRQREDGDGPDPYYEYFFTDVDIDEAVLRIKNPFFHDEEEWRYFFRTRDEEAASDEVHEAFAVRGTYIKPFVQLPRGPSTHKSRLPIVTVVCGPKLDGDLSVQTVRRFLRGSGYDVSVEHSRLAAIWR